MSIPTDAAHAAAALTRIATHLTTTDTLTRIRDAMHGHPTAARWDTSRTAGTTWCWTHGRDLHHCHRDGQACLGDTIVVHDPTGEAAIRSDTAAGDWRTLARTLTRIRRDADVALRILATYTPRPPSDHEKARTTDWNQPHCESCRRVEIANGVPWWVEPKTNGSGAHYRSTVAGRLGKPLWLCAWCTDHVTRKNCLPTVDELEQHRAGKRIRCPHPDTAM